MASFRITGLKEPVAWIKDENNNVPIGWNAGVGIEGLIPDLFKGYKYKYLTELISPNGQIVHSGILSQAPGYLGTSTIFSIGGKGLPPGRYTVRVSTEIGEEDRLAIIVPSYETYLVRLRKQEKLNTQAGHAKPQTITEIKNNNLRFVNDVCLTEQEGLILLTVERKDGTKYSAVLRDPNEVPYVNQVVIEDETIDIVRQALNLWGDRIDQFADRYLVDDRKEIELFNDIVILARCVSRLPRGCSDVLKVDTPTDLLHNRIVSQIMNEYHWMGCSVKPVSHKSARKKIHDFDIYNCNFKYKCEIKTIQSTGELERRPLGGHRLTDKGYKSIVSGIQNKFADAPKVGDTDVIVIAPWSYNINALLREYFKDKLSLIPPPPSHNVTILVLASEHVFEDHYVYFDSHRALSILENAFWDIQTFGIRPTTQFLIREGLTIQVSTAPRAGSSAGYVFRPPKEPGEPNY